MRSIGSIKDHEPLIGADAERQSEVLAGWLIEGVLTQAPRDRHEQALSDLYDALEGVVGERLGFTIRRLIRQRQQGGAS